MKWLNDWLQNRFIEAWHVMREKQNAKEVEEKALAMNQALTKIQGINRSPNTQSINFQIYPANGGHVVEVSMPETHNGLSINVNPYKSLHIVPSDKDLGEEISKIITYEMLKK